MDTAVVGRSGRGRFHVAICAEYDALPAVGHACGHNVIAAASVGAAIALASVADELGLRVTVLGTPAEEGGGGKIRLDRGGSVRRRARGADGPPRARRHPRARDARASASCRSPTRAARRTRPGSRSSGINAADALIDRAGRHRPAAPAHSCPPTASTASSPRAATRRTSSRRTRPPRSWSRAHDARAASTELTERVRALLRGRRPRDRLRADDRRGRRLRGHASTTPTSRSSTARTPSSWALRSTRTPGSPSPRTWATCRTSCRRSIPTIGIDSKPAVNHQPGFTTPQPSTGGRPGRLRRRAGAGLDGDRRGAVRGPPCPVDRSGRSESSRRRPLADLGDSGWELESDVPADGDGRAGTTAPKFAETVGRARTARCGRRKSRDLQTTRRAASTSTRGRPSTRPRWRRSKPASSAVGGSTVERTSSTPATPPAAPGCAGGRCWARTRGDSRRAAAACRPGTRSGRPWARARLTRRVQRGRRR